MSRKYITKTEKKTGAIPQGLQVGTSYGLSDTVHKLVYEAHGAALTINQPQDTVHGAQNRDQGLQIRPEGLRKKYIVECLALNPACQICLQKLGRCSHAPQIPLHEV